MEVGQLIAIMVEKGMDWKNVVTPATTKPSAATAPSAEAAPASVTADKTPVPSGQYVQECSYDQW